jgi:hypothetical protein
MDNSLKKTVEGLNLDQEQLRKLGFNPVTKDSIGSEDRGFRGAVNLVKKEFFGGGLTEEDTAGRSEIGSMAINFIRNDLYLLTSGILIISIFLIFLTKKYHIDLWKSKVKSMPNTKITKDQIDKSYWFGLSIIILSFLGWSLLDGSAAKTFFILTLTLGVVHFIQKKPETSSNWKYYLIIPAIIILIIIVTAIKLYI